ncbi:alpha/beta fold hydrolase [Motilibacter deserti]|uniref:Alpha/beta hydrolase n=1 Tax=Motilibacter deserti TaxID=2714956 RepID=A0ABX0GVI0_9ACTN|nr:alpha/beta hydrolase [Motilibacter deserti]NHC13649.1 alpha/beta hydrolase [Motilibacter deserti]
MRLQRRTLRRAAGLFAAAALLATLNSPVSSAASKDAPKPTVVLVHGAFADASGWNEVIERLQRRGYTAVAPANPLRSLVGDSAYVRSVIEQIPGPIVLVGHSYGGAVITNAATGNPNVKALVYIAAFALDQGENVETASTLAGGNTHLLDHVDLRGWPGPGPGAASLEGSIKPADFHEVFAGDLNPRETAVMAAAQRPAALATFGEASGVPAWKTIPSWYMVAKQDHVIPPVSERFMATRAGARTVEVDTSHVPMMSRPADVVALIREAAGD